MRKTNEEELPSGEWKSENYRGTPIVQVVQSDEEVPGYRVYRVTFPQHTRTNWHQHRGQQILYVLDGRCRVQKRGEKPVDIKKGDVVFVAPYEEHWHGAHPDEKGRMVHLAFTNGHTDWMEEVKDPEYEGRE